MKDRKNGRLIVESVSYVSYLIKDQDIDGRTLGASFVKRIAFEYKDGTTTPWYRIRTAPTWLRDLWTESVYDE